MASRLRLGTRASPLALAQSRLAATGLAARCPGTGIELVPIETRGDRDLTVPLAQVDDPEFFAAEIRAALRAGEIDFAVHSLKDLAAEGPPDLVRAALPPRAAPHDVIVFRADIIKRLAAGLPLRLGSCSLRRQTNVAAFLPEALPAVGPPPRLEFRDLRGPVDRRLLRIAQPAHQEDALDGVILALAGLERLWNDPQAATLVAPVLASARWMVLPLSRCPAAAGQAVLALECRADDERTRALLARAHDPASAAAVAAEQAALARWPEADRAWLGATAVNDPSLGPLCWLHGLPLSAGGQPVASLDWNAPPPPAGPVRFWDGAGWRAHSRREPLPAQLGSPQALFVAHWQAAVHLELPAGTRTWTSGITSWQRLAAQGTWVEGCADHLGFESVKPLLATPVLGLPPLEQWTALTHEDALPSWKHSGVGTALASYRVSLPDDQQHSDTLARLRDEARTATHFYWHSIAPLALLHDVLPPGAVHAAGPGKTPRHLAAAGIAPVQVFPDHRSWRAWLGWA
jgi:hydroxymethylbilane synthase